MKSYKIHLIRHGLTEANEKGMYLGLTDLPLSALGLKDLLTKKERAIYPSATRFFTSPLTRCKQTLHVLYPDARQEEEDGLAECDFGDWDGKTAEELKDDEGFQRWLTGSQKTIPDGEDTDRFQKRVMEAFENIVAKLLKSGDTEAVICTHGGVIMLIMAAYAYPKAEMSEWFAESGCGFTLRITPELWMREPVAEAIDYVPLIPEPKK